jgi:hypothetical protein
MSSRDDQDLIRAARRATGSVRFIASLLPAWQRAFDQRPEQFLGVDEARISFLSLCTRPSQERWEGDVASLASACGIDEHSLSAFLRQALTVERLAAAPAVEDIVDGRLLAARDREDKE